MRAVAETKRTNERLKEGRSFDLHGSDTSHTVIITSYHTQHHKIWCISSVIYCKQKQNIHSMDFQCQEPAPNLLLTAPTDPDEERSPSKDGGRTLGEL